MNLSWKNSTMISFCTWGKKVLRVFFWHLWVNFTLNETIMEKYFVLIQKKIKEEKSILFEELYIEFSKLKLTRFYRAKSNIHYLHKEFSKQDFDDMIKAAMTRKYKTYKK